MTIAEKVAYLKGLSEGLALDTESKEGKLISVIIDTLEDIAYELEDLGDASEELGEGLDAVSDDLSDVEEFLFGDEDDDDDYDCCCDDDCCCCGDEDDDDEEYEFEVKCPACDKKIVLTEADLDAGSIKCPSCGEKLEFEFDDEEEPEDDE